MTKLKKKKKHITGLALTCVSIYPVLSLTLLFWVCLRLLFQGWPRQPRQTSERHQERQRQSRRQCNEALQGDS